MNDEERDLIADLLVQWEDAVEKGEDVSAAALCTDCPHLTTVLQGKIESLKTTAWTKRDPARPLTDQRGQSAKDISGAVLANRYRLEALLGYGGYGQVYRGQDLKLQRPVAIKVGHHRTSCELLLDEARRVGRLKHPQIVTLHDAGEHDGRVFLVFELVEGESLADLVRKKNLSIRVAVDLIATVAESLHYAHEKGCYHRDIKPENILINLEGKPLVADFGVGCTRSELEKGRALSSGTIQYMSPEQVSNEVQLLDGRCDVHALGVVLFELLAGASPFSAKDKLQLREQILFRQPKRLREVSPALPKELDVICAKALSKHPADRHQTALELANELRAWLTTSKKARRWLLWSIIGSLTGVFAAFIVFASFRTGDGLFVRDGVMHFDGKTRIVTEVERTLPVTIEAWVKPDPYKGEDCQFVIGSDVPGKFGVGIGMCGSQLSAERIDGMINSPASVVPGEWSHIAGVFSESESRLYLNGKLVSTGQGSTEGVPSKFVIGNVGKDNLLYFFRGQVRSVRISEGERYNGDRFDPDELSEENGSLLRLDASDLTRQHGRIRVQVERF